MPQSKHISIFDNDMNLFCCVVTLSHVVVFGNLTSLIFESLKCPYSLIHFMSLRSCNIARALNVI